MRTITGTISNGGVIFLKHLREVVVAQYFNVLKATQTARDT